MEIIRTDSKNQNFIELVCLLDIELNSRYGILQKDYDIYNNVDSVDTVVLGYIDDKPAGCGCFKTYSKDTVEIKRMMVKSEFRGTGLAGAILADLEKWAKEKGFTKSVLETGIKQPEAIRFYTKHGYTRIDNYGQYRDNPNSICMSKELYFD